MKKKNSRFKCRVSVRVWWPKQLATCCDRPGSAFLFGWFLPSFPNSHSFDIVVVTAASIDSISIESDLQGILQCPNRRMPQLLQDKSSFSVLGDCASDSSLNGPVQDVGLEEDGSTKFYRSVCPNGFLEQYRQSSIINGNWIQFSYHPLRYSPKGILWTPELHHIHWGGQLIPSCDVHVIVYEPPNYGAHHFSLSSWGSAELVKKPIKNPMWVDKLQKKPPLPDLDTVILAINCATCAKNAFESCLDSKSSFHRSSFVSMWASLVCHLAATFFASLSAFFYVLLQVFHSFLTYASETLIYKVIAKIFCYTLKNIHIRSCQLLYWPVLLQDSGFRSHSNVEYAHRAALKRHSMWSSAAIDILVGSSFGFALLRHMDTVYPWVMNLIHNFTNSLLRSGCVWLMGVPAGFKLNTELAGVLGMISLNVIQIWSTLWFFLGFLFWYFLKALALFGIIFGVTVPAAVVKDLIMLATLHVSTLHWSISFLYSLQIKGLAALWRLFRGRKWNPLRQRFDSYNYTVKQHVVGSLLFAPLLLLLPTTSVFYIFFTILNTTASFICIMIEITVSILHSTPYNEIFLWVVRPRRFPSGIWFDILSAQSSNVSDSSKIGSLNENSSSKASSQWKIDRDNSDSDQLVISSLQSNFSRLGKNNSRFSSVVIVSIALGGEIVNAHWLKIFFHILGQVIMPYYKNVFCGVPVSCGSSAHGVLMGRRFPNALQTGLPPTMPWLSISYKEYWLLCFTAVLSCLHNHNANIY